MERHFMSRAGAVAVLVAQLEWLGRESEKQEQPSERRANSSQREALRRLILDVRAARVDAIATPKMEIVIKD
jgi:hypothetical protein